MLHTNLPFDSITETNKGITVMYPDGNTDTSNYTAILKNLPTIPTKYKTIHLFKSLASGALLSLGQLCDAGCTAWFNSNTVYIIHKGKIILQGTRNHSTNNLWKLHTTPPPSFDTIIHPINAAIDNPTIAERIRFYHASMFSPTLDTFTKAINAGYLTTFPNLTSQQIRRYPPRTEATVKGHMQAIRTKRQYVQEPSPSVNQITPII